MHDIRNKSGSTAKSKKYATVQARAEESAVWNADLGVQTPMQPEHLHVPQEGGAAMDLNQENEEDNGLDAIDALTAEEFDFDELQNELTHTLEEVAELTSAENDSVQVKILKC